MEYLFIILVCAAVFGLCALVDKGFQKAFRSRAEHMSGLAVRLNKRFGTAGVILAVLGVLAVITGIGDSNTLLIVGGIVILAVGAGLIAYYLGTGIFYNDDSFLCASFGKKELTYRYNQIAHQQLYVVQGGSFIVELHMTDGSAVQVLSQMSGYREFLEHAHAQWCRQRGIDPRDCTWFDPEQEIWFPGQEDL